MIVVTELWTTILNTNIFARNWKTTKMNVWYRVKQNILRKVCKLMTRWSVVGKSLPVSDGSLAGKAEIGKYPAVFYVKESWSRKKRSLMSYNLHFQLFSYEICYPVLLNIYTSGYSSLRDFTNFTFDCTNSFILILWGKYPYFHFQWSMSNAWFVAIFFKNVQLCILSQKRSKWVA